MNNTSGSLISSPASYNPAISIDEPKFRITDLAIGAAVRLLHVAKMLLVNCEPHGFDLATEQFPAFRKNHTINYIASGGPAIFSRLVKEGIMTAEDADNLMRETMEEIKDGDTFGNVFRPWEKAG